MFERETLQTRQFPHGETTRARRVVVDAAAAGDCVPERPVAGEGRFPQPGHQVRAVVWEVAGDAADCVVHGVVFGKVREEVEVFVSAVCRLGKVRERFAWAGISCSQ